MFIGWLNGWFSAVGFSLQASAPATLPSEYHVRGEERIKNPFTWDAGVEDIRTAISLEKNKQYLSTHYFSLADAYRIKRDKTKVLHYLQIALNYDRQYEAEAKTEIERNAGKASGQITKIFIQRCVQTDCTQW
ncbi:MAG TPA: hypothetical protein V6D19_07090 [Stenomitos sp.]